jgi:hypothetical protein
MEFRGTRGGSGDGGALTLVGRCVKILDVTFRCPCVRLSSGLLEVVSCNNIQAPWSQSGLTSPVRRG